MGKYKYGYNSRLKFIKVVYIKFFRWMIYIDFQIRDREKVERDGQIKWVWNTEKEMWLQNAEKEIPVENDGGRLYQFPHKDFGEK